MQVVQKGYRGVGLLVQLNFDRVLFGLAIVGALWLGSYFGS